ncbi:hypothetical protein M3914_003180 [Vibrio metschnikovii]|nr:hypothetical protein [Vibrio metschnikovii]
MTGTSVLLNTYRSELGDELFPKTDPFSLELNSLVGEVLKECQRLDKPLNYISLTETLSSMTPERLLVTKETAWEERDKKRWEDELKPQLVTAFENHFVNGGWEQKNRLIIECFSKLGKLGIQIEGKEKLLEALIVGDWQSKLLQWALCGRKEGVSFVTEKPLAPEEVGEVLLPYGFTKDAVSQLVHGGIRTVSR